MNDAWKKFSSPTFLLVEIAQVQMGPAPTEACALITFWRV